MFIQFPIPKKEDRVVGENYQGLGPVDTAEKVSTEPLQRRVFEAFDRDKGCGSNLMKDRHR